MYELRLPMRCKQRLPAEFAIFPSIRQIDGSSEYNSISDLSLSRSLRKMDFKL
jgi:hypothetical protein